jgi:hypothetical protein
MSGDQLQTRLNRPKKLIPEPGALLLLPPIRSFDICRRRRSKDG